MPITSPPPADPNPGPTSGAAAGFAGLRPFLAFSLLTALFCALFAFDGWIPHDEGLLSHCADRVLDGEVPHVDFDDMYTGGLTYLHALAFLVFGESLASLRILLLICTALFVPFVYLIARRFLPWWAAALVVALALVWSVPNYPASMPSWYNLFLGLAGAWTLVKYSESGRRGFLFIAGFVGGLSLLFKVTGLYFLAGAVLFLLYHESRQARRRFPGKTPPDRRFALLKSAGLLCVPTGLLYLTATQFGLGALLLYVVPGSALVGFLIHDEWTRGRGPLGARLAGNLSILGLFAAGVALPVAAFALPYLARDQMSELLHGIFVLPRLRLQAASYELPAAWTMLTALPWAGLLLLALRTPSAVSERRLTIAYGLFSAVVLSLAFLAPVYRLAWHSLRPLASLLALATALLLARRPTPDPDPPAEQLFLLVCLAAFMGLIQFPYAFGIYACYFLPLLWLGAAAFSKLAGPGNHPRLFLVALLFFLLFGGIWQNRSYIRTIGVRYLAVPTDHVIETPRMGIRVHESFAHTYNRLLAEIDRHAGPDEYIYAGPDSMEVYFLADKRNPTRMMYNFFRPEVDSDILSTLESRRVRVVVLNTRAEFSKLPDDRTRRELALRFPHRTWAGWFEVRWRDHAGTR